MKRRTLLLQAAAVPAALLGATPIVRAQDRYPSRVIKFVCPWGPAGITDINARLVAEGLSQSLGVPVIVDNKPGANGFIGTELAARAAPDGYTMLLNSSSTHAIAPAFYRKMPFDPIKDFEPVSQIAKAPTMAVVPPNSPYKTIVDLVAAAKASPGKLNYATFGAAGAAQLATSRFVQAAGIEMTSIPYKGAAAAVLGAMAGEVDVYFDSISSSINQVRGGKLRALVVTSDQRVPAVPDIPTLAESYPGTTHYVWQGVEFPAGTPRPIITRIHAEVVKLIAKPDVREKLFQGGQIPQSSATPEEFGQYIAAEKARMEALIRKAKLPYLD